MNSEYEQKNFNRYDGNGWSKYQLMVLQQLDDHNKVLQNLNKEIVDMKQSNAVSEAEQKMWKKQIVELSEDTTEKLDHILYDEGGIANRLSTLEKVKEIQEQTSLKIKASWAIYGAVVVFIIDVAVKLLPTIWNILSK
jgi:hypothetical protein